MASSLFFIVTIIIGIGFAGMSLTLGIFARNKRLLKYIPAGIAGIASLAFLVKAQFFSEGFEGLGYMIFTMISAGIFVVSIITSLIIEFFVRKK